MIRSTGLMAVSLLCMSFAVAQEAAPEAPEATEAPEASANDAAVTKTEIDAAAQATLDDLFEQNADAKGLYDKAAGYAAFTALKAGFFVTGGRGTGVAVNKGTGDRKYMRMATGGIGLGIGGQRYNLVVLFEDEAHLNRFIEGGWDASTSAQAAAGSDGITLTSSFVGGVAIYQITDRGLMAQADVSGTRFWVIDDLN
jgi:lipid-binding SYLF domain-containing protein